VVFSHLHQLGTIGHWVVRLSSSIYQIHHIRGMQNVIAETVSCMYDASVHIPVSPVLLEFPMLSEDIGTHQWSDPVRSALTDRLSSGEKVSRYVRRSSSLQHSL
jgi:hypothetical protein